MLEKVNLTLSLSKDTYKQRIPKLQKKFYGLAHSMFVAGIPSIVVFEGWATSGKGSTITLLTERLDARGFRVVPIMPPRTFELQYPWMWRFWLKIPAAGQMMIFDQSWYRRVLIDRLTKTVKKRELEITYQEIEEFEEQLANSGVLIIKFWLHITRKEQKKRMKKIRKNKLTEWQISEEDQIQNKSYDRYNILVEEMISRTNKAHAPWIIVEATDKYHSRAKIYHSLIRAFGDRLKSKKFEKRIHA
jgi:polyphosphate kinase 2 (PPK2 family)